MSNLEMNMKSLIIAASLIATVLAGTVGASAAERFNGAKFFEGVNSQASSQ